MVRIVRTSRMVIADMMFPSFSLAPNSLLFLVWPVTSARDERGTTINPDFCPGDVTGCVRNQEQDKLGDLLGGSRLSLTERDRPLWVVDREPDSLQVLTLSVI